MQSQMASPFGLRITRSTELRTILGGRLSEGMDPQPRNSMATFEILEAFSMMCITRTAFAGCLTQAVAHSPRSDSNQAL